VCVWGGGIGGSREWKFTGFWEQDSKECTTATRIVSLFLSCTDSDNICKPLLQDVKKGGFALRNLKLNFTSRSDKSFH